jgi:hypothetical protein
MERLPTKFGATGPVRAKMKDAAKVHWIRWLFGFNALLYAGLSGAWTSVTGPLTDDVHQKAIDRVLTSMSATDRKVLEDQQPLVDKDQEPLQSAEHAMTGIDKDGEVEADERKNYIGLCEVLIQKELMAAIEARKANNLQMALPALGKAMHTLEDATSPAHHGFQVWSYNFGIWEMASHVFKERVYPNDSAPDRYQSHLEGVVQYTYDIYTEKIPMPANFFDPASGSLILPSSYLHVY